MSVAREDSIERTLAGIGASPEWLIQCPVCGGSNCHLAGASVEQNASVVVVTPTEVLRRNHDDIGVGSRGSSVRLSMWCENGHEFSMDVSFHKGSTTIAFSRMNEVDVSSMPELWRN